MRREKGVVASSGVSFGKALVLSSARPVVSAGLISDVEAECSRFARAVEDAKAEIAQIRDRAAAKLSQHEADIFEAHRMMLEDPQLISDTSDAIKAQKLNAEVAFQQITDGFISTFRAMEDEYFRSRAIDLEDISGRVLRKLQGVVTVELSTLTEPAILVAEDLTPSQVVLVDPQMVLGFVTEKGGKTSHTAIIARMLEIPALVGVAGATGHIKNGDTLILDGATGEVVVNPDEPTLAVYRKERERIVAHKAALREFVGQESVTLDGRPVTLEANIRTDGDLKFAKKHDAEGVGLFRTEFLYLDRGTLPSEDEQFEHYRTVLSAMETKPVVIRTADIGGDKEVAYLGIPKEENPFLGFRAIRYCLANETFFRAQLRALLRASHYGNLHILLPFVTNLNEVLQTKAIIKDLKEELKREGIPFASHIPVGIMIEIPASALMSDVLAPHVDFFSIGTNDLIQYVCAVDRVNPSVSYLHTPYNPAVLRLIAQVAQNAERAKIPVAMCGEMAGTPPLIPLLIGMGLNALSMNPASILAVRKIVRETRYDEAKRLVADVLRLSGPEEVRELLESRVDLV